MVKSRGISRSRLTFRGVATGAFDRGLLFSNESSHWIVGLWKIRGQDIRESESNSLGSGFPGSPDHECQSHNSGIARIGS